MKKNIVRYFIVYLIPVLFFVWTVSYISQHPDDLKKVFSLSFPVITLLLLAQFLSLWLSSLFTPIMTKPFGIKLRFHEYFGITAISRTLNLLLPMKGGAGVRAIYLKSHHKLPVTEFTAIFAGQSVLTLFIAASTSLCGLAWLYLHTGIYDIIGILFFGSIATCFGFLVFWSPRLVATNNHLWNVTKRILDSWHTLRTNRNIVLKVCVVSFLNVLLSAFSIGLLFWALQNPQPIGSAIYLGGSQDVMYLASFTPGSLGVVEAGTIFLSNNLAINISDALLIALINRTILFLVSGLMTPWYICYLFGSISRRSFRRPTKSIKLCKKR